MQTENKQKILLISSSTGGHAVPVSLIYEELQKKGYKPTIISNGSSIERKLFEGKRVVRMMSGKMVTYSFLKALLEGLKLVWGFIAAFFILVKIRPNIIFSKGGFLALPTLTVAKIFRIPYIIHESDSIVGRANRPHLRSARLVFFGFPLHVYDNKLENGRYVGQIVYKPEEQAEDNVIMIAGGGQGSKCINDVVLDALPQLLKNYKVYHQLGQSNIEEYKQRLPKLPKDLAHKYKFFGFSVGEYRDALSKASLMVSRAGASSLGEGAALEKAMILIPYQHASQEHQLRNAKYMERNNAAIVVEEKDLSESLLLDRVGYLFGDDKNLKTLGKNAKNSLKSDGLNDVVYGIIEEIKK